MKRTEIHGVGLEDGAEPKPLRLSDGSSLTLEDRDGGAPGWTVAVAGEDETGVASVAEAMELAGAEHAEYVRIRTRTEAAWMRVVSEWFADQAQRLEGDLRSVPEPGA